MAENIREPVVNGYFYPAGRDSLLKMIDKMIINADSKLREDKELFGLISPHAGYVYSGPCAAYGYKLLKNLKFDTIVIMGPSHTTYLNGTSVWQKGSFKTPLGIVKIDEEITQFLINSNETIIYYPAAHIEEHSIEVQIPFLQYVLKDEFKIVPLVIGNQSLEYSNNLADSIVAMLNEFKNKKILLIASSDLSHYHSDSVAKRMDNLVVERIKGFDIEGLEELLETGKGEACGAGPILTLLSSAKKIGANLIDILNLTNSGEVSGDKSRVVGYLSAAIYK